MGDYYYNSVGPQLYGGASCVLPNPAREAWYRFLEFLEWLMQEMVTASGFVQMFAQPPPIKVTLDRIYMLLIIKMTTSGPEMPQGGEEYPLDRWDLVP